MIWLTWRQFRAQALIGLAALTALTVYLVIVGLQLRHAYDVNVNCADCTLGAAKEALDIQYHSPLQLVGFLVLLAPAVVGVFWGAPLIAREFETGTHRLVWNQSVTRTRWLAAKLAVVGFAAVAVTGALSLLLTWAASPYDKLLGGRFDPLVFPTRNIVPLGYAAFAIVAGITVGLLAKRTVPAMAVTLAAFAAFQVLVPAVIRPHLQAPVTDTVVLAADARVESFHSNKDGVSIGGYDRSLPGAWILSGEAALLDAAGKRVTRDQIAPCMNGDREKDLACLAEKNFHFTVTYQPGSRYWTFQWLELAAYLLLAALLSGLLFWRIRRG
ncbi:ABC transporter permease subunit [Catellatospora methionotrophica]|uniref:ABC transporter permease subunit n=1 Tax=Catellatospora methionotrophica TaxID=121620 RepID=UPI0033E7CF00